MSRSEDFDSEFWSDPDVAELSPTARYLYVWTWTNPRCNMSGVYRVTRGLIAAETGLRGEELDEAFAELEAHRFAFYDGKVVWVRSRVKRLRQKTENIAKSIVAHVAKVSADHPYRVAFLAEYGAPTSRWALLRDALSGLSAEGQETVGDTQESSDVSSDSATVGRVSPDTPRDGLGDGEKGGVGGNDDDWPDELPEPLRLVAAQVHLRLSRLAEQKGSGPVLRRRVGSLVADFPEHDHPRLIGEFCDYWLDGGGAKTKRKDLVRTYRDRCSQVTAMPPRRLAAVPGVVDDSDGDLSIWVGPR
ncbi:MAG: hypothetical protein AVDCRST_MAG68-2085 [uncultured Gemmatimonadetes bacterium]|uniref:Uncharacterized protein n=1 Tax=uncultured Gemmatimonadota bacterium TaxID=203437 RepID=A0A6J4L5F6_9BACT|nr:MAG: hypothetical protein AVDCRST_MAG68-2085 [uncultured Gemmatimonadota bacterium]